MRLTFARRASAWCASTVLIAALAGCSGSDGDGAEDAAAPSTPGPGSAAQAAADRSLADFDLFLVAEPAGNILQADLYGLDLDTSTPERLTSGKRVSFVSADKRSVVVSAADGGADRLALVGKGGVLEAVPGLGRPAGFTPALSAGSILYQTVRQDTGGDEVRFHAWDPSIKKATIFLRTRKDWEGPVAGPRGQTAFLDRERGDDRIAVRSKDGGTRSFEVAPEAGEYSWGRRWIAVTEVAPGSEFGQAAVGTVLLDPATGKQRRVPGWQPIAWSPYADGSLLVRKTTDGPDTVLALLDPDQPRAEPSVLITLPGLRVFQGAWAERAELPKGMVIPEGEDGDVASTVEAGVVAGDPNVRREPE